MPLPNIAPDGPLGTEKKGVLSIVGDPVGQVLDKSLRPTVGAVIGGGIGHPTGEALERVNNVVRNEHKYTNEPNNKADKDLPGGERIGGNKQSGQNPLGL
ncbi:hypothetical protein B0A48_00598 [Cryoendolithus antarcticus]|uniref:Uncharacterized protein n=1 Tax=Cryoendolithus antarcticus TaxID=1507870 RepID=A0A1V8TUY7_9PEZI|nr:hypothetical protein B0A48_00598 [Cryoendolithus antarcticus]OQO18531.1 hypothetical protein B0A51_13763 [Rachicladosporium sp. CCFEE 5018]